MASLLDFFIRTNENILRGKEKIRSDARLDEERRRAEQALDIQTQQLLATPSQPLKEVDLLTAVLEEAQRGGAFARPGPTTAERDVVGRDGLREVDLQSPIRTSPVTDVKAFTEALAKSIQGQPGGLGRFSPVTEKPTALSLAPPPIVRGEEGLSEFMRRARLGLTGRRAEDIGISETERLKRKKLEKEAEPEKEGLSSPLGKLIEDRNKLISAGKNSTDQDVQSFEKKIKKEISSSASRGDDPSKLYLSAFSKQRSLVANIVNKEFGGEAIRISADGEIVLGAKGSKEAADRFEELFNDRMLSFIDILPDLEKFRVLHETTKKTKTNEISELPNPSLHSGKTIRDTDTGERFISDGNQWLRLK